MLAFLQSSFLPQVPVKHHMLVCSPFTLNTHTHALEPSLPEKVKARNTQSKLESGMRHEFPSTSVSNSEIAVSVSAWQHIYTAPGSCVAPPPDRNLSCF